MTRRASTLIATTIALGVLMLIPSVSNAQPSPAWKLIGSPFPTVLAPGQQMEGSPGFSTLVPELRFVATNVGAVPATEPVRFSDEVPAGLEPQAAVGVVNYGRFGGEAYNSERLEFPCEVVGQHVSCETENLIIPSGAYVVIVIGVNVEDGPPTEIVDRAVLSGGGAAPAAATARLKIGATDAPFAFLEGPAGLSGAATDSGGQAVTQAGAHPYQLTLDSGFPSQYRKAGPKAAIKLLLPAGHVRDLRISLPRGMTINPSATPVLCKEIELELEVPNSAGTSCPAASQVGVVQVTTQTGEVAAFRSPLYNMVPPKGVPAELAFDAIRNGIFVHLMGHVNSSGNFELSAASDDTLARPLNVIFSIQAQLWGDPSDPSHSLLRGSNPLGEPTAPQSTAFITMPTSCSPASILTADATSWDDLSTVLHGAAGLESLDGQEVGVNGCSSLAFEPSIVSKATTDAAESPAGLEFGLHQLQDGELGSLSTANLKDATVSLPAGMTLNSSAANGLSSCDEQQIGFEPEGSKIRFAETAQSCPGSAKIGSLTVSTPLLQNRELPGSIYVAKPFDNPFGSLLAIYLAVEDEETGIVAKLAGRVDADSKTGRLTATFTENPELPIEDIDLHFFAGNRAALTTPLTCGNATTNSTLTPWSAPEGSDAHPVDSFQVAGGCSASESAAPKTASFTAGTVTPVAGTYSPFVLRLSRPDASQHITGIETTLPEGLLGRLAGVAYCPESGIAQAKSREALEQGKLERSAPSCPVSSEVGTVNVTAGAGGTPFPVSGHAYLAGPYRSAPLSLVVIVPAVAGPFDLGTVVDRIALNVGEYDARIHAVADPLPTILDGIPLDVRSIELKLSRPGFTLNPTSCEAKQIEGSFTTQAGQTQPLVNRFQVGNCEQLAFKPSLKLSLKGATGRTGHPALKAVVTYPKKGEYANIARAQVSLPHSEFLDQGNIGLACTKSVIAAAKCPSRSIYGRARAWSPLLAKPLEGPVYLVGGYGYKLPALVAELNGQIRVLLVGKVDTSKSKGIRNTFEAVPDAPISRFVLQLKGGRKYGLLINSENLCLKGQFAGTSFRAQNGRVANSSTKVLNSCGSKGKKQGGKRKS